MERMDKKRPRGKPGPRRGISSRKRLRVIEPERQRAKQPGAAAALIFINFRALEALRLVQKQYSLSLVLLDILSADLAGLAHSGLDPEARQQPGVQHDPGHDDEHDP